MPKRIKKKKIKKHDLKEDQFLKGIEELIVFYKRHQNLILGIIAGIILVAGGLSFYSLSKKKKELEAQKVLVSLELQIGAGRTKDIIPYIKQFIEQYWGTSAAVNGVLLLGDVYFNLQRYDDARKEFEKILKLTKNPLLRANAHEGIAQCMEEAGDYGGAIAEYKKAYELYPVPDMRMNALFQIARLHEERGSFQDAEETYRKIIRETESPYWKEKAQQRLSILSGLRQAAGG